MQTLKHMQDELIFWYEKNGRKELPWRNLGGEFCDERLRNINRAYGVYISEIMLQQTLVKVVCEKYYFPFLEKFPTLESLALAQEDELLKAWQGLGYYTRARNLKKAAQTCLREFGGVLPKTIQDLQKLSGVGAYTAGAIACFGYDEKVSFVDGNIRRVLSRLFALKNPKPKELEFQAQRFLNHSDAYTHNQALIDLGALLCLPKNPKCSLCPLREFCQARLTPHFYPQSKKLEYEHLNLNLIFLQNQNKFALKKSQEKLYYGLYNFIFFEDEECKDLKFLGEFKHSYTKYKIRVKIYHKNISIQDAVCEFKTYEFKTLEELKNLALSSLSLKALKFLV
ncbi:A/G-specific adenine glycosylase [Campylobacter cuniculorum]|uniref:Adenine DNA glycosylase n=2 Tax=Campylobacter cuniculorum TaxID=374106 RepID=A0A1W6BYW7_9BACT|nr:A/G-specific adenine glycosylase [Campylobacter cuniculorum]ARJ57299.1 A/G-specific adenine glycosylase [Campylobacter cuniculorum DSM 23162 = LMG 24588]QOR04734.1 A/G-specific adenine glycosylase [Campylobacter cuniculorum]